MLPLSLLVMMLPNHNKLGKALGLQLLCCKEGGGVLVLCRRALPECGVCRALWIH